MLQARDRLLARKTKDDLRCDCLNTGLPAGGGKPALAKRLAVLVVGWPATSSAASPELARHERLHVARLQEVLTS